MPPEVVYVTLVLCSAAVRSTDGIDAVCIILETKLFMSRSIVRCEALRLLKYLKVDYIWGDCREEMIPHIIVVKNDGN